MNKIGFAINRSSLGAASLLTCNPGDWTSHITDLSEYLKLFNLTAGEDYTIPFLSFIEDGCFLTIIRSIADADDYLGGWMYIPRSISVTGEELERLFERTIALLTPQIIEERGEAISALFTTGYSERLSSPYVPSAGERYGVRKPGVMSTMAEILENRYQESYKGFRAIFLTEPTYVAKEFTGKFGNFTNRKIEKSFIVIPPEDVSAFGAGTRLLVYNGEKYVHFGRPVRTKEGSPLRLSLKRPPFESYRFTYNATKDNVRLDLQSLVFDWKVRVSRSKFVVYGEGHKPIVDAVIRIGDEVLNGDLLVSESNAQSATMRVSAPGYEERTLNVDLIGGLEEPVEIGMYHSLDSYTRDILLAGNRRGTITVEATGLNTNECPLAGYAENSDGVLTMDAHYRFKQRAVGFCSALLLAGLVGAGLWGFGLLPQASVQPEEAEVVDTTVVDKKAPEASPKAIPEETKTEETQPEPESQPQALSTAAMNALRAPVWDKATLDAVPELQGLFDDLNHYRFANLTGNGKWAQAIRETHPAFAQFIENEFPDRRYVNPTFLPAGATTITIDNFKSNVLKAAERKKNGTIAAPATVPAAPATTAAPAAAPAAPQNAAPAQ